MTEVYSRVGIFGAQGFDIKRIKNFVLWKIKNCAPQYWKFSIVYENKLKFSTVSSKNVGIEIVKSKSCMCVIQKYPCSKVLTRISVSESL